jgi:hypothetical protein
MISAEWGIGYYRERHPEIIEGYSLKPSNPLELQKLELENKRSEVRSRREHVGRSWLFGIGLLMLLSGFILQLVGSWPK